ncbi:MAG: YdcF family protein [Phascolarctobacterium sp.]|nr:YdcF family protein [Clostridia bacterium]MBQ8691430.1 YdcF family protein [Phascolarctobacterium sp.]
MKKIVKRTIRFLILAIIATILFTVSTYNYTDKIGEQLTVAMDETQTADCIIVLGAGIVAGRPSISLANRLDKAIEVYNLGHTKKILVSGDHGQSNYDEVNVMRNYLLEKGVPQDDIFMDHAGFSTYDSMYRARSVFKVTKAIVVTQKLHLRRALYIGNKLGIKVTGVEAENSTIKSTALQSVREYPARVKAFLQCEILHSKPKYLGEVIPITGSGIETVDNLTK